MFWRRDRLSLILAFWLLTPISSLLAAPPARTDRLGDSLPDGAVTRFGTLRLHHPMRAIALAFSPDSKLLASSDGFVRLWDTETGRELRSLRGEQGYVSSVAFSPNGKLLATGGGDGTVILWDIASGKLIGHLGNSVGIPIRRLAFLPDGESLVVNRNGTILLWDVVDGRSLLRSQVFGSDFVLTPDGKALAVAESQGIWLHEVPSGKIIRVINVPWHTTRFRRASGTIEMTYGPLVASFHALSVSADGRVLAALDQFGASWVWDLATGLAQLRLPNSDKDGVLALAPDGKSVAVARTADDPGVWELPAGKSCWSGGGKRGIAPLAIAYAPDGRRLATTGADGRVRLWDAATGREIDLGWLAIGDRGASLSPDGKVLATFALEPYQSALYLTRTADGKLIGNGPIAAPWPQTIAFTPDSKTLLLWFRDTKDAGLIVIDTATGKTIRRCDKVPPFASWMVLSPDGKTLAGAHTTAAGVVLWDWKNGREVRQLKGSSTGDNCVAYSADGTRLATAANDGMVRLWDAATGKELRCLDGHGGFRMTALAFSPDGSLLASMGDDGFLIVWDVRSGEIRFRVRNEYRNWGSVAFSPDGRLLAANSEKDTFSVWDVSKGQLRSRTVAHERGVNFVAFLPDSKRLLTTGADGTGLIWEVAELKLPQPPPFKPVAMDRLGDPLPREAAARLGSVRWQQTGNRVGVALTPDGKTLIAQADPFGSVPLRAWDVLTGKEIWQQETNRRNTSNTLTLSADGRLLAVIEETIVSLRDPRTGEPLRRLQNPSTSPIASVALSPDGKLVAIANCIADREVTGSEVRLWDATTGRQLRRLDDPTGSIVALAFSADGRRLVSCSQPEQRGREASPFDDFDGAILVWDTATGKCLGSQHTHPELVFSPDGRLMAYSDGKAICVDNLDGVRQCQIAGEDLSCVFSFDGKRLATGAPLQPLNIWDSATGKKERTIGRENGEIGYPVGFSADGRLLATLYGTRIRLWDVERGEEVRPFGGHRDAVTCLAYSPDGHTLLTGSDDRTLRLWKIGNGEELVTIPFRGAAVKAVAIAPDGKTIVGAGDDGSVRLFDRASGRELHRFNGSPSGPERHRADQFLAFSPDGRTLTRCDADGATTVWDIATKKELRHEKRRDRQTALGLSRDATIAVTVEGTEDEENPQATVRLFHPVTGGEVRVIVGARYETFYSAALSPDNKLVALVRSEQGEVGFRRCGPSQFQARIFEIATGSEIAVLELENVTVLTFTPGGEGLVTMNVSDYGSVRLWDWASGRVRIRREGHLDIGRALACAPDGRSIATSSDDGTVLVWDVASLPPLSRRAVPPLSAAAFDGLWADLADSDGAPAYSAIDNLGRHTDRIVPLMRERLHPVPPVDSARIAALVADLDNDDFTERQRARMELAKLAELPEAALCRALIGKPSAEMRRQVEELLAKLAAEAAAPERLRAIRATALLERIGTAEARTLLTEWSQGAPEARLSQEAKASLQRLSRRMTAKP